MKKVFIFSFLALFCALVSISPAASALPPDNTELSAVSVDAGDFVVLCGYFEALPTGDIAGSAYFSPLQPGYAYAFYKAQEPTLFSFRHERVRQLNNLSGYLYFQNRNKEYRSTSESDSWLRYASGPHGPVEVGWDDWLSWLA